MFFLMKTFSLPVFLTVHFNLHKRGAANKFDEGPKNVFIHFLHATFIAINIVKHCRKRLLK